MVSLLETGSSETRRGPEQIDTESLTRSRIILELKTALGNLDLQEIKKVVVEKFGDEGEYTGILDRNDEKLEGSGGAHKVKTRIDPRDVQAIAIRAWVEDSGDKEDVDDLKEKVSKLIAVEDKFKR